MRQSWSQRYARRLYGLEGEVGGFPLNFASVPYCPSNPGSFFLKRNDPGKTESVSVHQSGFTEALLFDPVLAGCCRNRLSSLVSLTSMPLKAVFAATYAHSWWMAGQSEVIHFHETKQAVTLKQSARQMPYFFSMWLPK
jgi:hypothetical protein